MLTPKVAAKSRFMVTAGPDGVYRFERLAAAEYVVYAVEASMGGGGGESSAVTIGPGQNVVKDVQLPEGGVTVMVKVTGGGETTTIAQAFLFGGETVVADNVSQLETALAARAAGGGLYQHMSMGGGDVKLEAVQPGKYTLCALGLTINPMSPRMQELQKDTAQIPVKCVPDQTVTDAPAQSFTIDAPPLPPEPVNVKNPAPRP
jgi:hypothetical protein